MLDFSSPLPDLMGAIDDAINKPKQAIREYLGTSDEIKDHVKALKILHKQRAALQMEYQKELYLLEFKYSKLFATTYQLQRDIILDTDFDKVANGDLKKEVEEILSTNKNTTGAEGISCVKGIEKYWLRIFQNCPITCHLISEDDTKIMEYLVDIKFSYSKKLTSPGFRILFVFKPNPYFKSSILMKQFSLAFFNQSESLNEYGPLKLISSKASDINWSIEMKNKIETKSLDLAFFKIFREINPQSISSPEYEMLMDDYDLCVYIRDRILPYSVYWYTGEILSSQDI